MFGIDDIALAAGPALISGYFGDRASARAADAQRYSADEAAAVQRETYNTTRSDLAPYRDAGSSALARLMYLNGVGPTDGAGAGGGAYGSLSAPFNFGLADMYKDPGYQFRLDQGEQAINRAMQARGLSSSTPGLKSLMQFNQDSASQEYGAAFGRAVGVDTMNRERIANPLMAIAGMGQNASAMTGSAGASMASGTAQALMAGGSASAAGILGGASSWNNAIQGGLGNYMYQQRFDKQMNMFADWMRPQPTPNFEYTGTTAAPNFQSGAAGGYG